MYAGFSGILGVGICMFVKIGFPVSSAANLYGLASPASSDVFGCLRL